MINQMYIDHVMKYIDMTFVNILTGVRRCGKSTFGSKQKGIVIS